MKVSAEFKHYFKQRFAEWVSGVAILLWGFFVLRSSEPFTVLPVFMSMAKLAPYYVWGWGAILVGTIKITFLIVNGTWRRSAHLRTLGSILSVTFWSTILANFLNTDFISPNMVLAMALISADIFALWYSSAEAKTSDATGGLIRGNYVKE